MSTVLPHPVDSLLRFLGGTLCSGSALAARRCHIACRVFLEFVGDVVYRNRGADDETEKPHCHYNQILDGLPVERTEITTLRGIGDQLDKGRENKSDRATGQSADQRDHQIQMRNTGGQND